MLLLLSLLAALLLCSDAAVSSTVCPPNKVEDLTTTLGLVAMNYPNFPVVGLLAAVKRIDVKIPTSEYPASPWSYTAAFGGFGFRNWPNSIVMLVGQA